MCDTCGCGDSNIVPVDVHDSILASNDRMAAHNRAHFRERQVMAVNLMGSPGAGKTAVLEATARQLAGRQRLGALAGDLATDRDAERLRAAGITSRSITTGSACHLDAGMVHHGLHHLPWREMDYLFIENVGNLVCPAMFDLGERSKVVVISVTEGADKPLKYPHMFAAAGLVVINKIDLLPYVDFDLETCAGYARSVNPGVNILPVSATTGEGVEAWYHWIDSQVAATANVALSLDSVDKTFVPE
jgi:hydrogenase nickel incorporation protein HypB